MALAESHSLCHACPVVKHAQYEESSRNARLRQEFEEIYAQYQVRRAGPARSHHCTISYRWEIIHQFRTVGSFHLGRVASIRMT